MLCISVRKYLEQFPEILMLKLDNKITLITSVEGYPLIYLTDSHLTNFKPVDFFEHQNILINN